ncbi:hypothetical protein [Krasilnikovia sp. MM14-A1259]|uniref:hypothetical protein n=1 Tax=Krasilnikovia sp. MM14-A1259 TaxID=3373539 RepID=UPI0038262C23
MFTTTQSVPGEVMTPLMRGLIDDTAHKTLRDWHRGDPDRELARLAGLDPRRPHLHLGDPFGKVLVWLWRTDPHHAVSVVADVVAQMRHFDELATKQITLDDLLDALPSALQGLEEQEEDALIDRLRHDVPRQFTVDPNLVE